MPFAIIVTRSTASLFIALFLGSVAAIGHAATVLVQVSNPNGQAIADAAVYAEPASGQAPPKMLHTAEIEQKTRQFEPLVTVVQTGTDIMFPNHDTVRHHVYSLSPAKTFEIPLYSGEGKSVVFDKPGTVVVGCNIHDQMVAYIQVVNTPYFAKTDSAGKARLEGLMPGKYRLKTWHFDLPAGAPIPEQTISITTGDIPVSVKLNITPAK